METGLLGRALTVGRWTLAVAVLAVALAFAATPPATIAASRSAVDLGAVTAEGIAISPDGAVVAVGEPGGLLAEWSLPGGRRLGSAVRLVSAPRAPAVSAPALAFSADGRLLAAAATVYRRLTPPAKRSSTVTLFDTSGGLRRVAVLSLPGHAVSRLAFSPDGALLAVQEDGAFIVVFDVASGAVVQRPRPSVATTVTGSMAVSPDGHELAIGAISGAFLWDLRSGRQIRAIDTSSYAVAFDPVDASVLATMGYDGRLSLWNVRTGKLVSRERVLAAAEHSIAELTFSPNGRTVAVSPSPFPPVLVNVGGGHALGPATPLGGWAAHPALVAYDSSGLDVVTQVGATLTVDRVPG